MADSEKSFTEIMGALVAAGVDWDTLKVEGSGKIKGKTVTVSIELEDTTEGDS